MLHNTLSIPKHQADHSMHMVCCCLSQWCPESLDDNLPLAQTHISAGKAYPIHLVLLSPWFCVSVVSALHQRRLHQHCLPAPGGLRTQHPPVARQIRCTDVLEKWLSMSVLQSHLPSDGTLNGNKRHHFGHSGHCRYVERASIIRAGVWLYKIERPIRAGCRRAGQGGPPVPGAAGGALAGALAGGCLLVPSSPCFSDFSRLLSALLATLCPVGAGACIDAASALVQRDDSNLSESVRYADRRRRDSFPGGFCLQSSQDLRRSQH